MKNYFIIFLRRPFARIARPEQHFAVQNATANSFLAD